MSPKISKKHPKSNFAKRLQIIINGETFLSFERKCALPNKSIARYYDGQQPKLDALQSIILATGCNADWLITGRGEPFSNND